MFLYVGILNCPMMHELLCPMFWYKEFDFMENITQKIELWQNMNYLCKLAVYKLGDFF